MSYYSQAIPLPDPDTHPEFYASIPSKRLVAWVIDSILIMVLCVLISILTVGIGFFFFPALFLMIGFVYRTATLARGSATWGMAFMAMDMRRHDGARFDWLTAFLHTLGYSVSMAFVLPQVLSVLMMLIGARAQGLTDHVLGTVAINRRV
ncbi:RDD family protein [Roseovarius sp. M141]|uniref:RDD family protein n=1 Tax=Roseovarius sp. M141 TaxID=2583806 RepID=UPI0020CDF985|nr:RDD family protein [Roseovarius sp. M141]MCQ0092789.1 RDD family protein [Roseovarius sp. M141]